MKYNEGADQFNYVWSNRMLCQWGTTILVQMADTAWLPGKNTLSVLVDLNDSSVQTLQHSRLEILLV